MVISKFLNAAVSLLLVVTSATASTVYDELSKYGLPPGLLPDSLINYSVSSNGDFEVELSSTCYVKFTDLVYYSKRVKGKLSYGLISDLEGIEVKKLFAWLPITGILAHADGKNLDFQVGFSSESLPISLFVNIPHCGATKGLYRGSEGLVAKDALVVSEREKNLKAEEIVCLQMQLNESLKNTHIMEITIEELQRELNHVTAENEEAKKQIDCSKVEKASLKKHLETSNQRLQDVGKKFKALEDSSGQVFALLKKIIAEVKDEERTQENHINSKNGVVEVENDEERKLFVDNLEAINVAMKGKETTIKELNPKLELLQLSVAHANNKRRIWKWLFTATTGIFAAVSLAYCCKGPLSSSFCNAWKLPRCYFH